MNYELSDNTSDLLMFEGRMLGFVVILGMSIFAWVDHGTTVWFLNALLVLNCIVVVANNYVIEMNRRKLKKQVGL